MKNFLLFSLAVCMMACSNQEDFETEVFDSSSIQGKEVSVVSVVDGQILKMCTRGESDMDNVALAFSTQWAYENFKEKLAGMTKAQKIDYVKNLGVKSLKDLEIIADEELEIMDSTATSDEEFWRMYEEYKDKYAGILFPDNEDKNNLTLYAPEGDATEAYIANKDQVYVIGNKVVKAKLQPASKTVSLKSTVGSHLNDGSWQLPEIPEKTFCFRLSITEWNQINIRYYTRKVMWHGGSKDDPNRDYYVKYNLNNVNYLFTGLYGQTVKSTQPSLIYYFEHPRHGVDEIMGEPYSFSKHVTGYVRLWTDLTVEHNADGSVATEIIGGHMEYDSFSSVGKLVGGITIPKCLDSKAHYINIDLQPLSR